MASAEPAFIVGLGSRDDYVASVPGADVLRLRLTAEEATLFARVGRASRIGDLLAGSGLSEQTAIALLLALRAKGAIAPARVSAPPPPSSVDAASLEQVDLEPERKADILLRERQMESQNHYEALDLLPGASAEEIKTAYHELSRKFHPDRFFQKNLGSFHARVDRIFKRIREAYTVLSDDAKRAVYLRQHPDLVARPRPKPAEPERPARTAVDDARDAERRARLARHPYLARAMKVNSLVARGKDALAAGQFASAYSALHEVSHMRPDREDVSTLLDESKKQHETHRAREEIQIGNRAKTAGKLDEAFKAFKMAYTLDPTLTTPLLRMAQILLEKNELEEARKYAEKVVELEPGRPDHQVTLGEVYLAQGTKEGKQSARERFEEALRLSPDHEGAKKALKKTRRLF